MLRYLLSNLLAQQSFSFASPSVLAFCKNFRHECHRNICCDKAHAEGVEDRRIMNVGVYFCGWVFTMTTWRHWPGHYLPRERGQMLLQRSALQPSFSSEGPTAEHKAYPWSKVTLLLWPFFFHFRVAALRKRHAIYKSDVLWLRGTKSWFVKIAYK